MSIVGSWNYSPRVHSDSRGNFFEWFKDSIFEGNSGTAFNLAQANCSISKKGVVRGIHFAKQPPGQAKYVTCFSGKVFDVLVDLRIGSPTFGKWESIILDANCPTVVYIPSGIGHAFMALDDNSVFAYLCDQQYNPANEFDINPLDETLRIEWPLGIKPILSEKDHAAKSFVDLMENYPKYEN
jgi:dTDP-4-dehydrorhamnose 3,5-epimerase